MRLCFEEIQPAEGGPWSLEVESVPMPSPPNALLSAVVSGALDAVKAVIAHMERIASTHIFLNFGLGCCQMRADMARKIFRGGHTFRERCAEICQLVPRRP
jgi:hypothetical protein